MCVGWIWNLYKNQLGRYHKILLHSGCKPSTNHFPGANNNGRCHNCSVISRMLWGHKGSKMHAIIGKSFIQEFYFLCKKNGFILSLHFFS